jgi:hypothetical protein
MNFRSDIYTFNPQSSSFLDTSRVSNTSDPVVPLYQPTDLSGPLQSIDHIQSYGNDALQRIIHPDGPGGFLHGVIEGAGAILPDIFGDMGAGLQLGAQWMNNEVNGIPVLSNVLQPIGDVVNGLGGALVDICGGVEQSVDDLGSAVDDLFHGNLEGAAGDVVSAGKDAVVGAVDAVKDGIGSAISAIGDLF